MKSHLFDRRNFLGALSATTAGSVLMHSLSPFVQTHEETQALQHPDGYLLAPGLTYLNTGTLGPCRRETIDESKRAWEELESLPVKFYGKWGAEPLAESTRMSVARFLNCDMSEIAITTSTTDGMNAIAQGLRLKSGDRVLTTDQEHAGGARCWQYFAKYDGVIIDTISIPSGDVTDEQILSNIDDSITSETRMISISHIFSSTGMRLPIAKISALARSKGILCIVDGAQAIGAVTVNLTELGCHAYATSGHKWLMGPKGTGILYISKEVQDIIRPMQLEVSYSTYNDGSGVVNLACILGLGKAIGYLESLGMTNVEQHNLALRNLLYEKLADIPQLTLASPVSGPQISPLLAYRLPEKFESTAFTRMLYDKYHLSIRPTHKHWFNGMRFSMHIFNTPDDIEFASEVLHKELG